MTSFKLFPVHFICQEFKLNIETRENNANKKGPMREEEKKVVFALLKLNRLICVKMFNGAEYNFRRKLGRHRIALTNPHFDPISVRVRVCEGERARESERREGGEGGRED